MAGNAAPPSKPKGSSFEVFFYNTSKAPAAINWSTQGGTLTKVDTLEPGASTRRNTREGAVWVITNEAGRTQGYFTVGNGRARCFIPAK